MAMVGHAWATYIVGHRGDVREPEGKKLLSLSHPERWSAQPCSQREQVLLSF